MLAKEKGYDEVIDHVYYQLDQVCSSVGYDKNSNIDAEYDDYICMAPTQDELQTWFREKYNIYILVDLDRTSNPKFAVEIFIYDKTSDEYEHVAQKDWSLYRTYEEALEAGLIESLNKI